MDMFNNKWFYTIVGTICFTFVSIATAQTNGTMTNLKYKLILSSCTTQEPIPQLKNLSFAKRERNKTFIFDSPCNQTGIQLQHEGNYPNLTWYSYSPSPGCCENSTCHTLNISTLYHQTNNWAVVGSNYVNTITGIITNGPYTNLSYVWQILNAINDQDACATPAGLEISVGPSTFEIINGPTCSGIYTEEYCPGLRF